MRTDRQTDSPDQTWAHFFLCCTLKQTESGTVQQTVLQSVSLSLWPPVLDLHSGADTKFPQSQLKNSTHASYDTFSLLACVTWLQYSLAARHYTALFSAQCCQIRKISRSAQVVRPVCRRSRVWRQRASCNLPGGKIRNIFCVACKFSLDVRDFDRSLLPINIVSNFRDWFRRIGMRPRGW